MIHYSIFSSLFTSVTFCTVSTDANMQDELWADRWLLLRFHSKVKHTHKIKLHTLQTGATPAHWNKALYQHFFPFDDKVLYLSKKLKRPMWNIKLVGQWVIKIMQNLALNTQVWYLWKHEIINWRDQGRKLSNSLYKYGFPMNISFKTLHNA